MEINLYLSFAQRTFPLIFFPLIPIECMLGPSSPLSFHRSLKPLGIKWGPGSVNNVFHDKHLFFACAHSRRRKGYARRLTGLRGRHNSNEKNIRSIKNNLAFCQLAASFLKPSKTTCIDYNQVVPDSEIYFLSFLGLNGFSETIPKKPEGEH